jgi:tetratricopeptide (TPR) repeat protein
VIYQRAQAPSSTPKREFKLPPASHVIASTRTTSAPVKSVFAVPSQRNPVVTPPDTIAQAGELIRTGNHHRALQMVKTDLARDPKNFALLCLAAQAQANLGQLDEAEACCQAALAISSFEALPYQVLARTAGERGEDERAKTLLKKVIYLNPDSVRAYLELSAIYEREGDAARAAQMTRAALGVLGGQSDETPVAGENFAVEERLTAGEIKRQLQANRSI